MITFERPYRYFSSAPAYAKHPFLFCILGLIKDIDCPSSLWLLIAPQVTGHPNGVLLAFQIPTSSTKPIGQTDLKEQREETGLPYKGQRLAGMLD